MRGRWHSNAPAFRHFPFYHFTCRMMLEIQPDSQPPRTLIDDLLAEQQTLTAVGRFAKKHERHGLPGSGACITANLFLSTKPGEAPAIRIRG